MPKTIVMESATISFQAAVLKNLDKYCMRHDLQRSQVTSRAVKKFLASEMADDPAFWETLYDKEEI
jgi:metal-responsive CopG/Arc/MetJ family transcriptional regulator